MKDKLRRLKRNVVSVQGIGFLVSALVSLSFLIPQLKLRFLESLACGLLLVIVTQVYELKRRLEETVPMLSLMHDDPNLSEQIIQLLENRETIEDGWFALFKVEATQILSHCFSDIREMAVDKQLTTEPRSDLPYKFSLWAVKNAEESIKAVDAVDLIHWTKDSAREYLWLNEEAVKRGVMVERVFIATRDELRNAKPIIENQAKMGIKVYAVPEDRIPNSLISDYLLMDNKMVTRVELHRDGTPHERRTSINPDKVKEMIESFERLKPFQVSLAEL